VVGRAAVALFAEDAGPALAFARRVALGALGAEVVALAVGAFVLGLAAVEADFALVAVGARGVAVAVVAVASVAGGVVEGLVEVALFGQAVARARLNISWHFCYL
jgi:hypothetical protein